MWKWLACGNAGALPPRPHQGTSSPEPRRTARRAVRQATFLPHFFQKVRGVRGSAPKKTPHARIVWRGGAMLALLGVLALSAGGVRAQPDRPSALTQALDAHVAALSVAIGARPAASAAEARAAQYIAAQLRAWGYAVEFQPFTYTLGEQTYTSRNVIARRAASAPNPDGRTLVIGAHMDSVTAGTGADDNASGVAVMLAAAQALADVPSEYALVFVAFGAEEVGQRGSRHFVDALSEAERAQIVAMFNVDTVGAGDFAYVYAGAHTEHDDFRQPYTAGPDWVRELALARAARLGVPMSTSPPTSWAGTTGTWSDHAPFVEAGVPVAYFERWNWDAGDDPNWGAERAEGGDVLHTARDRYETVDVQKMAEVAQVLIATLETLARGLYVPPTQVRAFEIPNLAHPRLSGFHSLIYNKTMRLL